MNREIVPVQYKLSDLQSVEDIIKAIQDQIPSSSYRYLLAHCDDGVIWGRIENGQLTTSEAAFPLLSPPLRAETLWEARLFGKSAECYFWRDGIEWKQRVITDVAQGTAGEYFDEQYMLWGTDQDGDPQKGFYPVREMDTGVRHAPPVEMVARRSIWLKVRHYLAYDDQGAVFIKLSRLVDLVNSKEAKHEPQS